MINWFRIIDLAKYEKAYKYITEIYDFSTYNITSKNCTTFVVDVFEEIGIELPVYKHTWTLGKRIGMHGESLPGLVIPYFYGYSPGGASEQIRGKYNLEYLDCNEDGSVTKVQNPPPPEAKPWWMITPIII